MWAFSEVFSSHFSLSLHIILPKTDIFVVISASIQGPLDSWDTSSMNTEGQWVSGELYFYLWFSSVSESSFLT